MRDSRIFIVALLLITMFTSPFVAGDDTNLEGPTRVPNKQGSITTDETWSGTVAVDNVIVEAGVTVTIQSGTDLIMYGEAEIWVRGTLIVQGGENPADQVDFSLFTGSYWEGIVINDTGTADIQNTTFVGGHNYIEIYGDGVTVKNCLFDRGWTGVIVHGGSDHDIGRLSGKYIGEVLWIRNVHESMTFRMVAGVGVTTGVVHVSESYNISLDYIVAFDCRSALIIDGGCTGQCGNIFARRISANETAPGTLTSSCVRLSGPIHGLELESVMMKYVHTGIELDTNPGSKIKISEMAAVGGVDTLIGLDQDVHGVDMEIYDSILSAENNILDLSSDTADVNITAINSRLGSGSFSITGEPVFNLSWYINLTVVNVNMDPLDYTLNTFYHGGEIFSSLESEEGYIQLIIPEFTVTESGTRNLYFDFELEFDNGGPLSYLAGENILNECNSDNVLVYDLPPYNTMPESISFPEGLTYIVNLTDFFHDQEDNLTFEIGAGPELEVETGSEGDSDILTITSMEDDWNGFSWVNISAEDDVGNTTSANVTVEVTPVNDPPEFSHPFPGLEINEDESVEFDIADHIFDVDNDTLEITFEPIENCSIVLNGTRLELTPSENWFGNLTIELNISDGTDFILGELLLSVNPVNDAPAGAPFHGENILESFMLNHSEFGNIKVFTVILTEDSTTEIRINGSDVETTDLSYGFLVTDLQHGSITNPEEEVTFPDNSTEMVPIPDRFIYTPDKDSTIGDLVRFTISDGDIEVSYWVSFNVTPVNDPPVLTPENDGNLTASRNQVKTWDLLEWASDVEGDNLIFRIEPSEYLTVEESNLTIDFMGAYEGAQYNATIFVSDGEVEVSHPLRFTVEGSLPGPDLKVYSIEIKGEKDGWQISIYADADQEIYVVVLDGEDVVSSFKTNPEGENYMVFISDDDADVGNTLIITDGENGDEILPTFTNELPKLEEESETVNFFIYIILAVVLLLVLIIVIVMVTRGKKEEYYEE